MEKVSAVIVAAGKGLRMGGSTPKQYLDLEGLPVLARTLMAFEKSAVDEAVVVCPAGDTEYVRTSIVERYGIGKVCAVIEGGRERFDSCRLGIEAVSPDSGYILVHDGARPFVTPELINKVTECSLIHKACCPGIVPRDTVRIVDEASFSCGSPVRSGCRLIQTPQGFEAQLLIGAYRKFFAESEQKRLEMGVTDDAMLVERFCGCRIFICDGESTNIKITAPEDMATARYILNTQKIS